MIVVSLFCDFHFYFEIRSLVAAVYRTAADDMFLFSILASREVNGVCVHVRIAKERKIIIKK